MSVGSGTLQPKPPLLPHPAAGTCLSFSVKAALGVACYICPSLLLEVGAVLPGGVGGSRMNWGNRSVALRDPGHPCLPSRPN